MTSLRVMLRKLHLNTNPSDVLKKPREKEMLEVHMKSATSYGCGTCHDLCTLMLLRARCSRIILGDYFRVHWALLCACANQDASKWEMARRCRFSLCLAGLIFNITNSNGSHNLRHALMHNGGAHLCVRAPVVGSQHSGLGVTIITMRFA